MIETLDDSNTFELENFYGDWIVHVVPLEDNAHPVDNSPSILFIRNTSTSKTYYFAFDHPDSHPTLDNNYFLNEVLMKSDKIKWALDKKAFCQFFKLKNVYDANLCGFLKNNEIEKLDEFETSAHGMVRRQLNGISKFGRVVPLMKHKESFDDLADAISKMIKRFPVDESFHHVNDIIISTLGEIESNGIYVNSDVFSKHFTTKPNADGYVFSQYNIYTSTGRPSNRYGGVNYAALNHSDGSRKSLVSRYGDSGRMVVVDYTAFHPRIICTLTNYSLSVDIDIYEYLAKLYFKKKTVDETDIANSKQLTFRQLYGGVDDKYSHIKYLTNLNSYINDRWEEFQKNEYVVTPFFKRKITIDHIKEPSPTKVFNYILQAVEGEIAIPRVQMVLEYLKNKRTKAILYTYDAVLYDFHKDDGLETLNEIRRLMSMGGAFPMKTYIGESYQDVKMVSI